MFLWDLVAVEASKTTCSVYRYHVIEMLKYASDYSCHCPIADPPRTEVSDSSVCCFAISFSLSCLCVCTTPSAMLRSRCSRSLVAVLRRRTDAACFSSSAASSSHQPNAPLDLDPSFNAFLKDVELSLLRKKSRHATASNPAARAHRELEVFPSDETLVETGFDVEPYEPLFDEFDPRDGRKSPAAAFGSQRIRQVVLPLELQNSIDRLISGKVYKCIALSVVADRVLN